MRKCFTWGKSLWVHQAHRPRRGCCCVFRGASSPESVAAGFLGLGGVDETQARGWLGVPEGGVEGVLGAWGLLRCPPPFRAGCLCFSRCAEQLIIASGSVLALP